MTSTQFRIALFEFLALPAHLWLRFAAFLIGAKWVVNREFTTEHDYEDDDYGDGDPSW